MTTFWRRILNGILVSFCFAALVALVCLLFGGKYVDLPAVLFLSVVSAPVGFLMGALGIVVRAERKAEPAPRGAPAPREG